MAVTFTPDTSGDSATNVALASGWYLLAGTLTFSGSYSTGGDSLDLAAKIAQIGPARSVISIKDDVLGYGLYYDKANKKLKLYSSAGTELSAASYPAALTAAPVSAAFLVKG